MDMRDFKEFFRKRSTIWTLSLCMTGIIVLGGIAAVDRSRRGDDEQQVQSELGEYALLPEEAKDVNDTLDTPLDEEDADAAEVSGSGMDGRIGGADVQPADDAAAQAGADEDSQAVSADGVSAAADGSADGTAADGSAADEAAASAAAGDGAASAGIAGADGADSQESAAVSSAGVVSGQSLISEQALLSEGIAFAAEQESLLWPAAGSILIDYSMDGSVYFPTLNQYKYNPALVIGSDAGNQVLAAAKGIVESIYVDEETGTTLVMNIGNGYRLTYGQLKELAVAEGDVVEAGAVIGYVSEPTKYYTKEGSNLYFAMTENSQAVDPILYLE